MPPAPSPGAMAYDEGLAGPDPDGAGRTRRHYRGARSFGGITFMVAGRMACGVVHDDLMVRVGPDGHDEALVQPGPRSMDFTGKPSRGMVYVASEAIASEDALRQWLDRAVAVATAEGSSAASAR